MQILKYILKNINLLNILLIIAIVISADYAISPFLGSVKYKTPASKQIPMEELDIITIKPPVHDPLLISEQNLFHPERKIPPEKRVDGPPQPKPEFVLYGTTITDTVRLAYMEDKTSPASMQKTKRHHTLKKGDVLSGYVLREIEEDRVVMERDDEKIIVTVYDSQKTRGVASPQPPQPVPTPPQPRRPIRPPIPPRTTQ